ncbi:MAG TPA: hypothetical protein VFR84_06140, partial [Candidatus Angelobacter sp.]|nr:hypothetical protein [Candidatus Angelobacter sp.]
MTRMTLIYTDLHKKIQLLQAAFLAGAVIALAVFVGCKSQQPSQGAGPKAATISLDPATAGSISGVVSFRGAP